MYKQYLQQTLDFIKANPDKWDQFYHPIYFGTKKVMCFGGWLLDRMGLELDSLSNLPIEVYTYLSDKDAFAWDKTLPELEIIVNDYKD